MDPLAAEMAKQRRHLCVYSAMWLVAGTVLLAVSSSMTDPNGLIQVNPPCHIMAMPNYTLLDPVPSWLTCNNETNTIYEIDLFVSTSWNDHLNRLCFGMETTDPAVCNATHAPSCHGLIAPDLSFLDTAVINSNIACKSSADGQRALFAENQDVGIQSSAGDAILILLSITGGVIVFSSSAVLLMLFCSEKGPAACRRSCTQCAEACFAYYSSSLERNQFVAIQETATLMDEEEDRDDAEHDPPKEMKEERDTKINASPQLPRPDSIDDFDLPSSAS